MYGNRATVSNENGHLELLTVKGVKSNHKKSYFTNPHYIGILEIVVCFCEVRKRCHNTSIILKHDPGLAMKIGPSWYKHDCFLYCVVQAIEN